MRTLLLATLVSLIPSSSFAAVAVPRGPEVITSVPLSEKFTVKDKDDIPGKTLKPGTYTITVVDHMTERVILRVSNDEGKVETTFLGLYNNALSSANGTGPVAWGNLKGNHALRGFVFPGSRSVEFVYPKEAAVEIAKHNPEKVLAIDPASDNLHLKNKQLTQEDMQLVTLWMLNSTRVGPTDQPAIAAARYESRGNNSPIATASTTSALARVSPPSRNTSKPATQLLASNAHTPVIRALPHTASNIGGPALTALLAFVGAGFLRLRRSQTAAR